jgi:hypothetical protein
MLNYLRKRLLEGHEKRLDASFSLVHRDIGHMRQTISHLYRQHDDLSSKHQSHSQLTYLELKKLSRWMDYLQQHVKLLNQHAHATAEIMRDYEKRLQNLENSQKGQLRTSGGTTEDISKDISRTTQDIKKDMLTVASGGLTASEIELLQIIYASEKPLSYLELAKLLNKREKSVRNMIYEIKNKGIRLRRKPLGFRKMGFYLPKEIKLQLSGR